MGLVKCPSCEQITAMAASHRALALCEHCGRALPQRRQVITIARQLALASERSAANPVKSTAAPHAR